LRTALADIHAAPHRLVAFCNLSTRFGTLAADFGTDLARSHVVRGCPQHEICACDADLRTVGKRANMLRCRVPAAEFQAVRDRFDADSMTFQAVLDALTSVGRQYMWHVICPP
jgi:hypothetical protein